MSNFSIKLRSICELQDGKKYRVIDISDSFITLIEMDTNKIMVLTVGTNALYSKILEGDVKLIDPDSDVVVDMDFLSGEQKEKYEAEIAFIHDVEAHIQTSELTFRDTGKVITELCLKHGVTVRHGRTIIRRYLQSGRSRLAICDQRVVPGKSYPRSNYSSKPGRPVEFGIKQGVIRDDLFYEAIDSAYKKYMEGFSMHEAYEEALKKHYSYKTLIDGEIKSEIKPDSEIPTFRQVQYELTKRLSQKDKDLRIMNSTELRNSKRLLLSDNLNGVLGPGDLAEIDNCEADISLVSESDRTQSVGRPIITVMIDVYSRMILAVSVGFDNNSIIALTSCLRFLAEDPKDILQKYGIEYDGPALVTGVYPSRVRPDRGPEYKSHKFLKICNRLGIERSLVPAATGSMKGLVENLFSVLTRADSAFFKGSGLIRKGYDPDHHKQAVMTISEYTKHVLLKTIEHNTKYMKGYPLTPDQIRNKIPPIPITLFMDGIEEHGMIRRIKNREQFLFDILVDDTAKISKKGITWKGLYYTADDIEILDLMYEAGTKSKPIQIRRDKRDVSYLYYTKKDGRVLHLDLNLRKHGQDQYVGMSEEVLLYFRSQKRQMDKKGESYNTRMNAGFNELTEGIVKEAKKKTSMALDGGTVSTKDMRKRNTTKLAVAVIGTEEAREAMFPKLHTGRRIGPTINAYKYCMDKAVFETLVKALFKIQWFDDYVPVTQEIVDALYIDSQGIIDQLVGIYQMMQYDYIMSKKRPSVNAEYVHKVVDKHFAGLRGLLKDLNNLTAAKDRELLSEAAANRILESKKEMENKEFQKDVDTALSSQELDQKKYMETLVVDALTALTSYKDPQIKSAFNVVYESLGPNPKTKQAIKATKAYLSKHKEKSASTKKVPNVPDITDTFTVL